MTEQTKQDSNNQLTALLQQVLPGLQQQQQQAMQPMMMQQPQMQPAMMPAAPAGVLIPVSLQLPDGSDITIYLQYGSDMAQNPQMLTMSIMSIMQQWPVKVYQQQGGGYGGGYNRQYGGGYNSNYGGGGYQRRSFRRY
jgi:hypothetical protein